MDRIIRPYADSDLGDLLFAWEDASKIAHPFLTEAFLATERDNIPNLYLPNADTWVIEQNGLVIGFVALLGNEIGAIFVRADCHGTGAGRALMDKAKQLHPELEVEVFEANAIGRKFYASCGFTLLSQSTHEPTGQPVLRLKYSP